MKSLVEILSEACLNEAHIKDLKGVRYIRHYTTLRGLSQIVQQGYIKAQKSEGDDDWATLEKMNLVGALNEEGTEYAFSGSVVGDNGVEYTFNATATIAEEEGGEDAAFAPKRVVKKAALKESAKKRASLK